VTTPGTPAPADPATMSLVEHLEELRSRIIVIAISVVLAGTIGFFVSEPILVMLQVPLPPGDYRLVQLSIGEALAVRLKIALYVGIALSVPVIFYEIWRFVTPGLTKRERRLVWPILAAGIVLFALGVVVGYVIIPYALSFLLSLTPSGIDASMVRLSDYVSFVLAIMLAFGLAFQFPVVLVFGARLGLLNYRFLSARRRWAIVGIVLFAIIATPGGDPASSAVLSLVMYTMFEATLQVIRAIRP
jgi:sec-independent protein translocase protein TatC